MSVIEAENLSFSYRQGKHIYPVLKNLSFRLESGEMLCLLGPNGVGKSTLFQCILGIHRQYTGRILVNGIDIKTLSSAQLAKEIAYIPQSHSPAFHYRVLDVVLMGTASQFSLFSSPGKKARELAFSALEMLGIEDFADRNYTSISGGERQLVLIARAIAQQSRIIIMDEPTSNLDYGNIMRVLTQIKKLTQNGYTIMQSTHNPDHAFLFADTVMAIYEGKIAAKGTPKEVINSNMIHNLYNVNVQIEQLYDDSIRVCIPDFCINT